MTEREYIQSIKAAAEAYIAMIRNPDAPDLDGLKAHGHWAQIKEKLSPWTAVEMCDAWLEKNGG